MTLPGFDTRLRHTATEATLLRHLDAPVQRILDVAGGTGLDAVRLAVRGHEVTVLDPAGAMLTGAIEAADAAGVVDRLHVVQAAAEDVPELFGPDEFDVVLCHNLVQYVPDRRALLAAVTAPLRRGGLLSVLAPNADSAVPPDGPACTAAEVIACLVDLGLGLVLRYGAGWVRDDPATEAGELERLELAMSDRMPQLLTARYLHLIARR